MRNQLIITAILLLIMIVFPLITLINDSNSGKNEDVETVHTLSDTPETYKAEKVNLTLTDTGKKTELSISEYVYGAVCAEMPASYQTEALKAQAVVCYTYLKWLQENSDKSSEAIISDNPEAHQAYISEEELRNKWGSNYSIYSEKITEAVESVLYEYLSYDGEAAMTVYHALSPGKTSDASEIWKNDVPYLKSVTAPGDKLSPEITNEVILTTEEFLKPFEGADYEELLNSAKKSSNGFINEIKHKDKTFTSTDLRSAFKLSSPYFTVKKKENDIIITVYGKGHGVGMSQYSADYMARQGSTYEEILAHFYEGTILISK